MTHDCDQSQCVFLQKITLTCWLTLSLCFYSSLLSVLLFTFLIEISTIFTITVLMHLLKHIYVRFLTNYVKFVPLLL